MNAGRRARSLLAVACVTLALAIWPPMARAAAITIADAAAGLQDGHYLLDATVKYAFSDAVLEALSHGVPLVVELHVELRREGAWLWEPDVADQRVRSQIRYSPLSATYQTTDLETGARRTFATREAAIGAIGELRQHPIAAAGTLTPGQPYLLSLRAALDIEALPLPLRPRAYLSQEWNLSSGWSRWRLRP
jgi:hypothetical protein